MNLKINYIYRYQTNTKHSIEGIFRTIEHFIAKKVYLKSIQVKTSGGSPQKLLKNIFALRNHSGINHITGDIHYIALKTGRNTVLTIHDIRSIIKGHPFKKLYLRLFWFYIPALIVKKITVISEFSKRELLELVPYAKNKVVVVPNPLPPQFKFKTRIFDIKKPTILCLGTKENKNLLRVFEAIKDVDCKLVIIGQLKKVQSDLLERYQIEFDNQFNLSDNEMKKSYENCDLLCFPSIYEGFGMPIIEAQAIGRPIITSNFGAMKEVAQNTACLVDPYSVDSIRTALTKIIEDKNYRESLVQKGLENVKRYDVSKIVEQYESIYRELAQK